MYCACTQTSGTECISQYKSMPNNIIDFTGMKKYEMTHSVNIFYYDW